MGRTGHAVRWEQSASSRAARWRSSLFTSLGLSAQLLGAQVLSTQCLSACSSDTSPKEPPASRADVPACTNRLAELPPPNLDFITLQLEQVSESCTTHADCDTKPYGMCVPFGVPTIVDFRCDYGCTVDADCGADQLCLCGESIGRCVPANCLNDAECGGGLRCLQQPDHGGCGGPPMFHCQTEQDTCAADAECGERSYCNFIDAHWQCEPAGPVCGRPFLVAETERRAALRSSNDWQSKFELSASPAADLRGDLAAHWAQIALMEHASVAAFGRFTLQLLQFGAPAQLVQQSVAAAADEIEHARLAFALASHYAGRDLGPGPLALADALNPQTLTEVLELVLHEGCIGETLAAFEAAHATDHCQDPELKRALHAISDDEHRHAELAWSFVHWALGTDPSLARVIAQVRDELRRSVASPIAGTPSPSVHALDSKAREERLLAHGVVSPARSTQLRRIALTELVLPALSALLASAQAA